MSKTITKTASTDLMRAAGTARGTKASARRRLHLLLGMVLLIGWIFSGVAASAQVPGAPYVAVAFPNLGSTYGYYVFWVAPASSGGSEITEYKISAKVSPTAGNNNATAKLLGEVTTEVTGIPGSATFQLIVLSSLNNFDPKLASISDSFTCTVSVYAKNASGYGSAGSAVVSGTNTGVYAGRGVAGFSDGPGRSALFNGISGLAMDSTSTHMYIADRGNHSIRRMVMSTYAVTTLAGPAPRLYVDADSAPTGGFADANSGTNARFNCPSDLALAYTGSYSNAGAGKLIVADTFNSLIRAVNLSTGATTTIAGVYDASFGGVFGYRGDGGAATAAWLCVPEGVAVDSKGNIYIADTANRVIRKINSSDGIIHTIAGGTDNQANTAGLDVNYLDDYDEAQVAHLYYAGDGGPATSATLSAPTKLTLDVNDNLYFIDRGNNLVRRIDATTQIITTVAGTPPVADPTNSKPTVDTEGNLIGVSSGDGGLANQATLGGPGALYINAFYTELMLVESERKLRIVNITNSGNGRIASDKYLASDGRGYTWSSVAPVTAVSAITGDNKGLSSIFYIADAYSIYGEIGALQRRQNYSLDPIPVLSFATPTSASVQVGTTFTNVATSSISGEGSGAIAYKTSAPSIATVNYVTGLVTGVAAGTVTITATQAASSWTRTNDTASTTYALTVTAVVPSLATPTSASVGLTSATLGGTVTDAGAATLSARGVVYAKTSDNSNPTIGGTGVTKVVAETTETGAFTLSATGLSQGTTYSYAAYATNSFGTAYSSVGTFTTTLPTPTLSFATATPASIAAGATLSNSSTSSLSGAGNGAISYTSSNVGIATVDVATGVVTGVGVGTATITATQAAAAGFNNQAIQTYTVTVTAVVPSVATPTSAGVGTTSATLGGTVTATGGVPLIACGVVYARTSDNSDPRIGGANVTVVVAGSAAAGGFTANAVGLTPGITYSYTAYATNSVGTAYSSAGSFTTMLPTPALSFAAGKTASVAVGATFANAATSSYSGVGYGAISYSSSTPTIATVNAAGVVAGVGVGTVTITASQAAAAGFNNQASETYTLTVIPSAPSVGSPTSASIRAILATLGGTVTATGGVNVTARGVVYARTADNANPQIGGANVTNVPAESAGMGAFTVSAAGLSPETAYSYAAYATNSVGVTYTTVGTFTTGVDFSYTDNGTLVTITGYTGDGGAVTIPGTIGGHLVTGIAQGAFANCTSITSVTIPASVTSIGKGAFAGCTLLQTFSVDAANASFSSLGGVLFDKTQGLLIQYPAGKTAPGYTVPDSVTSIGSGAFSGCVSLKNVTIPDSVTRIGQGAFADCSGLTSATIGTGVAAIEADAFARCVSLPSVLIPGTATLGTNAFPEGTTVRRYYTDAQLATRSSEQYAAGQTAGRADVTTAPNTYSLYTVGQIQNVSVGNLVLTRNADGSFTLNYDLEQSADLVNWTRFQSNAVPLSGLPADKAFVRMRAK